MLIYLGQLSVCTRFKLTLPTTLSMNCWWISSHNVLSFTISRSKTPANSTRPRGSAICKSRFEIFPVVCQLQARVRQGHHIFDGHKQSDLCISLLKMENPRSILQFPQNEVFWPSLNFYVNTRHSGIHNCSTSCVDHAVKHVLQSC